MRRPFRKGIPIILMAFLLPVIVVSISAEASWGGDTFSDFLAKPDKHVRATPPEIPVATSRVGRTPVETSSSPFARPLGYRAFVPREIIPIDAYTGPIVYSMPAGYKTPLKGRVIPPEKDRNPTVYSKPMGYKKAPAERPRNSGSSGNSASSQRADNANDTSDAQAPNPTDADLGDDDFDLSSTDSDDTDDRDRAPSDSGSDVVIPALRAAPAGWTLNTAADVSEVDSFPRRSAHAVADPKQDDSDEDFYYSATSSIVDDIAGLDEGNSIDGSSTDEDSYHTVAGMDAFDSDEEDEHKSIDGSSSEDHSAIVDSAGGNAFNVDEEDEHNSIDGSSSDGESHHSTAASASLNAFALDEEEKHDSFDGSSSEDHTAASVVDPTGGHPSVLDEDDEHNSIDGSSSDGDSHPTIADSAMGGFVLDEEENDVNSGNDLRVVDETGWNVADSDNWTTVIRKRPNGDERSSIKKSDGAKKPNGALGGSFNKRSNGVSKRSNAVTGSAKYNRVPNEANKGISAPVVTPTKTSRRTGAKGRDNSTPMGKRYVPDKPVELFGPDGRIANPRASQRPSVRVAPIVQQTVALDVGAAPMANPLVLDVGAAPIVDPLAQDVGQGPIANPLVLDVVEPLDVLPPNWYLLPPFVRPHQPAGIIAPAVIPAADPVAVEPVIAVEPIEPDGQQLDIGGQPNIAFGEQLDIGGHPDIPFGGQLDIGGQPDIPFGQQLDIGGQPDIPFDQQLDIGGQPNIAFGEQLDMGGQPGIPLDRLAVEPDLLLGGQPDIPVAVTARFVDPMAPAQPWLVRFAHGVADAHDRVRFVAEVIRNPIDNLPAAVNQFVPTVAVRTSRPSFWRGVWGNPVSSLNGALRQHTLLITDGSELAAEAPLNVIAPNVDAPAGRRLPVRVVAAPTVAAHTIGAHAAEPWLYWPFERRSIGGRRMRRYILALKQQARPSLLTDGIELVPVAVPTDAGHREAAPADGWVVQEELPEVHWPVRVPGGQAHIGAAPPTVASPVVAAQIDAAPVDSVQIGAALTVAAHIDAAPADAAQIGAAPVVPAHIDAVLADAAPVVAAHIDAAPVVAAHIDAALAVAAPWVPIELAELRRIIAGGQTLLPSVPMTQADAGQAESGNDEEETESDNDEEEADSDTEEDASDDTEVVPLVTLPIRAATNFVPFATHGVPAPPALPARGLPKPFRLPRKQDVSEPAVAKVIANALSKLPRMPRR